MTEAAPAKVTLFGRFRAWRRNLSLAARASWIVFGILSLLVAVVWTIYFLDAGNLPYRDWMSWPRMLSTLGLVGIIPVVSYFALQLWLQGDSARFPDIDYAWNAGLEALRRAGLSLDSAPLFLIVGCGSDHEIRQFMAASGMSFRVAACPEGRSALCWYANPDGIWLFCTEVGWHSALAKLVERKLAAGVIYEASLEPSTSNVVMSRQTVSAAAPVAPATVRAIPQRQTDSTRGTILLDQFVLQQTPAAPVEAPAPAAPAPVQATTYTPLAERISSPSAASQMPAIVNPQDAAEQTLRLEYLCQLVRAARQPLCGTNGVLTLIPFEQLQATGPEIEELQRAIKLDLLTIQRGLALRCPVSALVIGMERERGFRELVRRVGPERAFAQRFGRRYDVRSEPTPEAMLNFASHVSGVFEDWIYTLFRENQALTRPGNTRLYSLLCKMRCNVKPRLGDVLIGGFGYDPRQTPQDDPFLFSGCYFASVGESSDLQAFVKGILEKSLEEQEHVEWTRQSLAEEQRALRLIYLGVGVALLLVVSLIGLLVSNWF